MSANPYQSPRELAPRDKHGAPQHPYLTARGAVGGACIGSMAGAVGTVLIRGALLLSAVVDRQWSVFPWPQGALGSQVLSQWSAVDLIAGTVAAMILGTLAGILGGVLVGLAVAKMAAVRPGLRGSRLARAAAMVAGPPGAAAGALFADLDAAGTAIPAAVAVAIGAALGGLAAAAGGVLFGRRLFMHVAGGLPRQTDNQPAR